MLAQASGQQGVISVCGMPCDAAVLRGAPAQLCGHARLDALGECDGAELRRLRL